MTGCIAQPGVENMALVSRTRCSATSARLRASSTRYGAAPQSRDPEVTRGAFGSMGPGSAAHHLRAALRPGHETVFRSEPVCPLARYRRVGKGALAPCPPPVQCCAEAVGTLRFAHPTRLSSRLSP